MHQLVALIGHDCETLTEGVTWQALRPTVADGIINPPIDELLDVVDSKYQLVIMAAKRARQINAYYSQLGEGLLEYVGPLVETRSQEKPLSISLREVRERMLNAEANERLTALIRYGSEPRVVLGVGAGIAAYKACELLRRLTESGHQVRVVPTPDALRFVGEATWAALSGQPVTTDAWTGVSDVPHVRLGQTADLVVVAPATADLMARAAAGMAGDLLTATLLTARCPVLYAPAMHTEMWEHPATQANVALLRRRGAVVLEPAPGRLTGEDSGPGRLPEPDAIFAGRDRLLARGALSRTWPAAAWWCRPAAPGRNSTRCGSSATGPPGRRDTRWRARRSPEAPR